MAGSTTASSGSVFFSASASSSSTAPATPAAPARMLARTSAWLVHGDPALVRRRASVLQVISQRLPDGGVHIVNDSGIQRVIDADRERAADMHSSDHRRVEFKAQKVHRRRLLVILTRHVLVRQRVYPLMPRDLHPYPVFDAAQSGQHRAALFNVRVLDQHGGFPVGAIRDERVISVQFVAYA